MTLADPNAIFVPGGSMPQLPPAPDPGPAPDVTIPATVASAAVNDIGASAKAPSPLGPVLERNRWALTKPAGNYQQVPGYMQGSTDPNTGQPAAMSPSLTKLGKLLTVLRAAGAGAAVGSTQPTFGGGFQAAQQNENQQTNQFQQQQQHAMAMETARQNLGMVQTPWGTMPLSMYRAILPKVLPAQIAGESRENVADTAAGAKKDVAGIQATSKEKVANILAQAKKDTAAGVPLTAEDIKKYNLPPQFLGTKAKITDIAAAERAGMFENIPMMTASGLVVVNRKSGNVRQATDDEGEHYAAPALAMPREVADPNNPGNTIFAPAGQLASGGYQGTGSTALQVPRQAAKAEVPTKIGDQKVAFTTMIQHAQLLRQAASALHNGDEQTLAGLKNRFKNEFGYAGPITSEAIADAYRGEVANVINKGHITDTGNERIAHTLDPRKQNYETLDSVLGAYEGLAQSKMNMLNQQEQGAIDRAQAKRKPGSAPAAPPATQGNHPSGFSPF